MPPTETPGRGPDRAGDDRRDRGSSRTEATRPTAAHPKHAAHSTAVPRVLVVEDDAACRRNFTRTLREAGYAVLGAEDGRQAAAVFHEQGADVIVTDLFMPRMDGIDLLINLMVENPGLPIIAITGAAPDDPRIRAARRFGFLRLLEKPCSRAELTRAVHEALNR